MPKEHRGSRQQCPASVRGEANSPGVRRTLRFWIGQVQELHKGCPGRPALRCSVGRGEAKADRDSETPVNSSHARVHEACERMPGEVRVKAFVAGPRGAKPMGGAGGRRTKPPGDCRALPGGKNPGTEVCQAGLTRTRRKYCQTRRYAGSAHVERREAPPGRDKPPKGESQERCRCETEPARDSRE